MCFPREEGSPDDSRRDSTKQYAKCRVLPHIRAPFPAPYGPRLRDQDSSLRVTVISPYWSIYIYIYLGIRAVSGGRNDPLSGVSLGFISHPRARILDYSDFQL